MKVEEAVAMVNWHRKQGNLNPIKISTRPSYSAPNKTTIEVKCGDVVFHKSVSWGVIVAYLKGMLQVSQEKPVVIETPSKVKRMIDWR